MQSDEELLKSDFEQCFEHMRHYDNIFMNIVNYILLGYTAIFTASTALLSSNLNMFKIIAGVGILSILSSISATLLLGFLMRNRVYFVSVAKYVNEIRNIYLKNNPLGIKNSSGMYVDNKYPKVWNWGSTHLSLLFFVAFLNSLFFAFGFTFLVYIFTIPKSIDVVKTCLFLLLICFIIFGVELVWVTKYLKSKDKIQSSQNRVFCLKG